MTHNEATVAHFKITLEHMNEGGGKLKEPAVEKAG
jgi:hypothetical protein